MFSFLIRLRTARLGMLRQSKGLQSGNLLVQRCKILLDDIGQFGDFDGPIIEERLSLGHCTS